MKRREFLKLTTVGPALLGGSSLFLGCGPAGDAPARRRPERAFPGPASPEPLQVAEAAGAWIRSQAREARSGLTWPVAPRESEAAAVDLYSGSPGVILFLLELHHATGDPRYLQEARDGTFLLQGAYTEGGGWPAAAGVAPDDPALVDPGLYTGMSGAAFTLLEVYKATGDQLALSGAFTLLDAILTQARSVKGGVAWFRDDPATARYDIISGSAGIGLTLLYAYDLLEEPVLLEVAGEAGAYLAARGRSAEGGLKWPPFEESTRFMPNFSHGTAGVAYYLARLAEATEEDAHLEAAIQGARYIQAVSRCTEDGCLVFHHEPGGEDLFYLGWCHGPPGTARLFFELSRITGDPSWMEWVAEGARAVQKAGIPEERPEGYWNNVGQCCGDAGVGDFFLALAGAEPLEGTPEDSLAGRAPPEAYAGFARRLGSYLAGKALTEGTGAFWLDAEERARPDSVRARTGWMQGAAGAGAFFLHLDGLSRGRKARIIFPDSPWGGSI